MATDKLQFRPRARIIRTIGDQLISGPEAAVAELVKNAYDADARTIRIKFFPPLNPGKGRITVTDDGHGMTIDDVRLRWMEPATSTKQSTRVSPLLHRRMMGSKGIGRFAAAKLGTELGLSSVSERSGRREAVLIPLIDWSDFDGDKYLSDIAIDFEVAASEEPTGTELEIRQLNEEWSEARLRRLHTELRRLVSPLDGAIDENFHIFLDLSECTREVCGFEGAEIVNQTLPGEIRRQDESAEPHQVTPFPLLTSCDYEVAGEFDGAGVFTGSMQIRRAGQAPQTIELTVPILEEEDDCGEVGVRLFIFDREADAIKLNMQKSGFGPMSAAEARDILDRTAGVAIYRDGFRVRPYGDPQNDWLTLDRRRVQNPSRRIGHNQIAGYVTVQGPSESGLEERSSREGFEDNAAFERLRRLIVELLARIVEPRRVDFRVKVGLQEIKTTTFNEVRQVAELEKIRRLIRKLPEAERAAGEKVVSEQSALLFGRIEALEERQRVLEAKSALGAIIAEIIHEGAPLVGSISRLTTELRTLWPKVIANDPAARQEVQEALPELRANGKALADLFRMLKPLSGARRGAPQLFRPADSVASAIKILKSHEVPIRTEGAWDVPEILGYPEDLTTAMVNLLGNSIHWLEQSRTPDPIIKVRFIREGAELAIYVEDNGPGVPSEFADQIFDAGFSLKESGTGLGLNIAREAVARSGGQLFFHIDHTTGALFEFRFDVGGTR